MNAQILIYVLNVSNQNNLQKSHKLEHAIVGELVPISRKFDPETDISQVPNSSESSGCFGSVKNVKYREIEVVLKNN